MCIEVILVSIGCASKTTHGHIGAFIRILNVHVVQKFLYSVVTIPTFRTKRVIIFSMWVFRGSFRGGQGVFAPSPLEGILPLPPLKYFKF